MNADNDKLKMDIVEDGETRPATEEERHAVIDNLIAGRVELAPGAVESGEIDLGLLARMFPVKEDDSEL